MSAPRPAQPVRNNGFRVRPPRPRRLHPPLEELDNAAHCLRLDADDGSRGVYDDRKVAR